MQSDHDVGTLTLTKVNNSLQNIEAVWRLLVEQSSPSYFLSWGWIQAWIRELPESCNVYFVEKKQNNKTVFAFFAGVESITRRRLFKIRQLSLNISGNREYDNLWMEYNSILCSPDFDFNFKSILKEISLHWDEFYLPALDLSAFPANTLSSLPSTFRYVEDNATVSPYVALEKVRHAGGDYSSLLSGNTRAKIRRSLRLLEKIGPIELEVPEDLEHAFHIYREMVELHQSTWEKRGEKGAFISPLFCRFHERLIRNRFQEGEIQLCRIRAGSKTIGCLYNFLWQKRVYFYQCGLNYALGKNVNPGLVSHHIAVQYNAEQGHDAYDFLAGDDRYKRSLATDYNKMSWGRIQRISLKLNCERRLQDILRRVNRGG